MLRLLQPKSLTTTMQVNLGWGQPDGSSGTNGLGGGGGGCDTSFSTNGGSGVAIVSSLVAATSTTGSPTLIMNGALYVYKFTASGSITF